MLYLTMGNEGWAMQAGLDKLIAALETDAPKGLSWVYVDRRQSEHHGSIYHPAALDAFRTFYPVAHREGHSPKAFYLFVDGIGPSLSKMVKQDLKFDCTNERARRTTFAEFNQNYQQWNGLCVLMKPGDRPSKGNLK
ncbi:MAG TPA: hypothetical protein ENJ42_10205 [Hellea balneolensis]|uniref:Uncharacterized protein n=1 Tax=Hellea balneolensis TaxID=287478 RepID=A0A7C5QQS6_9PROT|nr:hypothetical protein [Hellea balneolensis]